MLVPLFSKSVILLADGEESCLCHAESPFEFRALEVNALEARCSFLAARTTELETAAYPCHGGAHFEG